MPPGERVRDRLAVGRNAVDADHGSQGERDPLVHPHDVAVDLEHLCHRRAHLADQLAEPGDDRRDAAGDRLHVDDFDDQRVTGLCAADRHWARGAVHALEVDLGDEVALTLDLAGEAVVSSRRSRWCPARPRAPAPSPSRSPRRPGRASRHLRSLRSLPHLEGGHAPGPPERAHSANHRTHASWSAVSTASRRYAPRTQATASAADTPARTAMQASTVPVRPLPPRQPTSTSPPCCARQRPRRSAARQALDSWAGRSPSNRPSRRAKSAASAHPGRGRTCGRDRRRDGQKSRMRGRGSRRGSGRSPSANCATRLQTRRILASVAVTPDEARAVALSMPEAVEQNHHGRLCASFYPMPGRRRHRVR